MTAAPRYRGVVIGTSMGGLDAMRTVLNGLHTELQVPVIVAQHLGTGTARFDSVLARASPVPIAWARDGNPIAPGTVHLCPGGAQVRVEAGGTFAVRPNERPSSLGTIDELFASAADVWGPAVLAIVLTGTGSDGTAGAQAVKAAGGTVVAQDEETAQAAGMPGSVAAAGLADLVIPLAEIPRLLERVVGPGRPFPFPDR